MSLASDAEGLVSGREAPGVADAVIEAQWPLRGEQESFVGHRQIYDLTSDH
jgi:hypothetical protein